ncbi:MAG: hypothetical protein V3V74_07060 [Nitrosomonadaceae bacterium]
MNEREFTAIILAWTFGNDIGGSVQKVCKEHLKKWMSDEEIKKLCKRLEK